MRAGILIGLSLVVLPALFFARRASRLLGCFADGVDAIRGVSRPARLQRIRPVTEANLANRYDRLSKKRKQEMALDAWSAIMESGHNKEPRELSVPDDPELFGESHKAQGVA
jgi:hypothetical protein